MNLRPALAALLLLPVLMGCASSSRVMTGQARPPIDPAQVQIYNTPPAGSVEIAQLQAVSAIGFGTQGQTNAAIARLKNEAAALGANGIVLIGLGSQQAPVSVGLGGSTYGRNSSVGVGMGVPATQKNAAGVAIWVPPALPSNLRSDTPDVETQPRL